MSKIKNFFICLKYPFMKSRNVLTGKFLGYKFTMLDDISNGWRIAFGNNLCEDIKKALKEDKIKKSKWSKTVKWEQIKEKWGKLCLYASTTEKVQQVLTKYELLSICYCECCGNPSRYISRGWISYICKDCARKTPNIDRLTLQDAPKVYDKTGVEINLKEKYGIDYKKDWGLNDDK